MAHVVTFVRGSPPRRPAPTLPRCRGPPARRTRGHGRAGRHDPAHLSNAGQASPSRSDFPRMAFDLDYCLRLLIESGGSDLHLKVPASPVMRVDGNMRPIEGLARLTGEDTDAAVRQMLDEPDKLREFAAENEVDFSYSIPGVARFRVNAFKQRGS